MTSPAGPQQHPHGWTLSRWWVTVAEMRTRSTFLSRRSLRCREEPQCPALRCSSLTPQSQHFVNPCGEVWFATVVPFQSVRAECKRFHRLHRVLKEYKKEIYQEYKKYKAQVVRPSCLSAADCLHLEHFFSAKRTLLMLVYIRFWNELFLNYLHNLASLFCVLSYCGCVPISLAFLFNSPVFW